MSENLDVSENMDDEQVDILYLAPHRQQEQHAEIDHQDGPVNGDVEHVRGRAKDGNNDRACRAEP